MNQLENARKQINEIDQKMAELFERRMDAVTNVIQYKLENNLPIFDGSRENEVIERNSKLIKKSEYQKYYQTFLQNTMDVSKDYQHSFLIEDKIGYQGTEGAFSHIALNQLFDHVKECKYNTFEEVFKAIINKEIKAGVVPIENSYAGEVGEVMDLIYKYPQIVIQQCYDLKVEQNLLVKKGVKMEDIKKVYSKDQALFQCAEFFQGRNIELIPYTNTALAAKLVKESDDKSIAAIASKEVAELYGLDILFDNINTIKNNTTRFVVIGLDKPAKGNRFSLLFTIKNEAGCLAKIINIIGSRGFNMESIKSNPMKSIPWEYYFYTEIVGDLNDEKTKECLKELEKECTSLRIIGCYTK